MVIRHLSTVALGIALLGTTLTAYSHGLVEEPPSRNWLCGAITKPDEVANGTAEYPECGDAFANDFNGGYQFMSVLTHDVGRAGVSPLPDYVCGFGSETFNGGATPWDSAADWPTSPMAAGRQEFKWNIQWGPHFDDTEEFRYWITKADFQYERNRPLAWSDFETDAFCVQNYNDAQPNANPDVIALKDTTQFRTFCDVPQRSGRHIIYAEWGRNEFTFERFHGCVDVVFDGSNPPPPDQVVADFSIAANAFVGAGSITLDGTASQGSNLDYTWSISAPDSSVYTIVDPTQAVTTLQLANPAATQTVTVSLLVANSSGSSSANDSFSHEPESTSIWVDLGQLVTSPVNYAAGDQLSVRTVSDAGVDTLYPSPALELSAANAAAADWPLALAQAVNATATDIAVGVLNGSDQVVPIGDATANRVYAVNGAGIVSAFLQVDQVAPPPPPPGDCTVTIRDGRNGWWAGLDVGADASSIVLDFTGTGLDLSTVTIDGVFGTTLNGQLLTLSNPGWVTDTNPGYLGFNGSNNNGLASFTVPGCSTP